MIPAFIRLTDAHTLAPGPVKVISRVARGLTRCRLAWERNHLPLTSEPVAAVDTANGSAQRLYSPSGGWKCCAMLIRVRKNVHATCHRQGKLGYQTPAHAEQTMREAMGEHTDIRKEFKLPLACTT